MPLLGWEKGAFALGMKTNTTCNALEDKHNKRSVDTERENNNMMMIIINICSAYSEVNALCYVCRVELSLFFLFHLSYSCLFLCCLFVLPYYMVNKDEYYETV